MARSNTNGMGRRGTGRTKDVVINSGQRKTVGTSIYQQPIDSPSSTEFRAGMLSQKEGSAKSDAPDSRGGKRKAIRAQSMGARYTISPNVNAVVQPDARTQRSSRVVPPVMGRRAFYAGLGD